jgi:DNA-binding response OmpR family regulator
MQEPKTVLIVEDDADNGEMLAIFFEQEGFEIVVCESGDECLEHIGNRDFSAVILDYHLPEKDGLEVCREIRGANEKVPIILFTADARKAVRDDAAEAGADAVLVKPDDLTTIVAVVAGLIDSKN